MSDRLKIVPYLLGVLIYLALREEKRQNVDCGDEPLDLWIIIYIILGLVFTISVVALNFVYRYSYTCIKVYLGFIVLQLAALLV